MALPSPTVLVGGTNVGSTTNASSYATATFTVASGSLLIYACAVSDADDPGTMNISNTGTWTSLPTWTERCNVSNPTTITDRLKIWTGVGGASSGASTITVSGMPDVCTGRANILLAYPSGWDTGAPIINIVTASDNTTALSETLTFAAAGSASNHLVAFLMKAGSSIPALTTEGNWALTGVNQAYASPNRNVMCALDESASDTTVAWTWTTVAHSCSAGVEVVAAAGGAADPFPFVGGSYYPTEG